MHRDFRKLISIALCLSMIFSFLVAFATSGAACAAPKVKNIIVLVPDGCGATHTTLARWLKGQPLAMEEMVVGAVRTYSADSMITDSAPAATAFATGHKSNTKFVAVLPAKVDVPAPANAAETDKHRPVATILEGMKLQGKATGLVATANIQHATPAAFSAHTYNRNDYNDISEQQVYQQIDVVFGGGKQYLLPKSMGGQREDGANLVAELRKMGYEFVETPQQMKQTKAAKVWGLFANDAMAYDFDRNPDREPSLAEMTAKAIEILSRNKKGFFLFVEGSKVDWASHANDPIGVVSDVLAFDAAVKVALDFAKKDKSTLVLVFADHGNGGMSIGSTGSDKFYDTLKPTQVVAPLKKAIRTGEGIESLLDADRTNIQAVMAKYYGITDLSAEEITAIKNAKPGSMNYVVGPMISKRAFIGWTTSGHTGEDLFLYAYGPGKPSGTLDNTEIAKLMAETQGIDLNTLTQKLFVRADTAFAAIGAEVTINNADPKNPVVVVTKGTITAELPMSTNIIRINGVEKTLKGITVISRGRAYVPQEAVDMIKAAK